MKKFVIVFLLCAQGVLAQVSFEAKASKYLMSVGEKFRVDFVLNAASKDFVPPKFDGFKVVAGPIRSYKSEVKDGEEKIQSVLTYYLSPLKSGTFTINPATARYNDATYQSLEIKVTVTEK